MYPILEDDVIYRRMGAPAGGRFELIGMGGAKSAVLNGDSDKIISLCTGERTVDDIISSVAAQYPGQWQAVERQVLRILTTLDEQGFIKLYAARPEKTRAAPVAGDPGRERNKPISNGAAETNHQEEHIPRRDMPAIDQPTSNNNRPQSPKTKGKNMKSKILVILALLAVMASVSHAMPWFFGGWVKVDTTALHNGTPVWMNGVTVTCIENGMSTASVDGIDYRLNPPQAHPGYFLVNCQVLPPAGTYTACFRWGNAWKHVTFSFDGIHSVNLGDVLVTNYTIHPPHKPQQQQ